MDVRRILCPVEFRTDSHLALDAAQALARAYDAQIVLAHAVSFPYPYIDEMALGIDLDAYYANMESMAARRLDALGAEVGEGVTTRSLVLRGDPAGAILAAIDDEHGDMIVMPTHGRVGFQRLLVGSITETVVRSSSVPVLTIPPTDEPRDLEVRRILVPTDFSDRSDAALAPAFDLARRFDAEVLLLHVVTLGEGDRGNAEWSYPTLPAEHVGAALAIAEAELTERTADDNGVRVTTELVRGFDAGEEILRVAAEKDSDLIAMTTHGHSGLKRMLLGSTAAKVVRHSERPVLTIRAE